MLIGKLSDKKKTVPAVLLVKIGWNLDSSLNQWVWEPFRQKYIDKLEKNQRSAARFVIHNYRQTVTVASLIQNLG